MVVCGYIAGLAMGLNSVASIFLGAVISGTSTAVVVAVLHEREKVSIRSHLDRHRDPVLEDPDRSSYYPWPRRCWWEIHLL